MIIVEQASTIPTFHFDAKKYAVFALAFTGISFLVVPLLIAVTQSSGQPTGTYLSPVPEGQVAQVTPSPTTTQIIAMSPAQAVLSAQAFLEKAITLSQKDPQNDQDKQEITQLLSQSLDYANTAVELSPKSPQTYLARARVLATSSSVWPQATQWAQKDLEVAQKLANGQPVDLPTKVNLLSTAPVEQANTGKKLVIAAPEETKPNNQAQTAGNTLKDFATIPAGKSTLEIKNPNIKEDSYLYIIPKEGNNTVLFVQSKTVGKATIGTSSAPTAPLEFEYWIVNP